MKGAIFYGKYTKGVPFLSKMLYKRVKGLDLGLAQQASSGGANYVFCTHSHEASGNIDQYSSLDGMFTKLVHRKLDNALAFYDYDRRCPFIQLGEKTQCGVKFLA